MSDFFSPKVRSTSVATAGVLALLLGASSARAHHSFAMYDSAKLLKLEGTVKEFQWTNPHVMMWLTKSAEPAGEVWTIELPTSPGNLARMSWNKRSLKPGDHVIVELNPLRDGQHGGSFKKATLVDTGVVLVASAPGAPGAPGTDGGAASPYGAAAPGPTAPAGDAAADHDAHHDEHTADKGPKAADKKSGGCACSVAARSPRDLAWQGVWTCLGLGWLVTRRRSFARRARG